MNYDPIHDQYLGPVPENNAGPDTQKPDSQPSPENSHIQTPQKPTNEPNRQLPPDLVPPRGSESSSGQSMWNSEPAKSEPPAPYKPFSIDSLMGGGAPVPPEETQPNVPPIPAPSHQVPRESFRPVEIPPPVQDPRLQDPRLQDPRIQNPALQSDPRLNGPLPPIHSEHGFANSPPAPPAPLQNDPRLQDVTDPQLPGNDQKEARNENPAREPKEEQHSENALSPEAGQLPADFREISRGYKYLKKADGEPFWRKDIQHDFLDELFTDETRCFTNYFPFCEVTNAANEPKLTFAELYVRTLAESNKLSKILRERLIKEKDMGIAVSKVCLLVNAGRMNTTVNFVPDMRSALRTYHSIPSLQTSSAGDSRPLQDTPRLKTILKAVCDDQKHLLTLLDLFKSRDPKRPNTNVIKLIFLMSTFFQNIPFHYDDSYEHDSFLEKFRFIKASPGPQNKFMEFFLNDEIHPKCRSKRFLWLMYTYLETNFTAEEIADNPFNAHTIPPLEYIPEAELPNYDVDTDYEVEYAIQMYHTRMMHLSTDAHNPLPKKGNKSRRERQKIQTQLNDGSQGPAPYPEEQDDLMNIDDSTLPHQEEPEVKPEPPIESAEPIQHIQPVQQQSPPSQPKPSPPARYVSPPPASVAQSAPEPQTSNSSQASEKPAPEKPHKRKRPAPSVGSLVEDNRKPVLDENIQKLTTPEFPIEGLQQVRERYATTTPSALYEPLTKNGPLSAASRNRVEEKLKATVDLVSRTIPRKFEATKETMLRWLHDYFQYRRSVGSKLLGIEWEDIRSDVANGIETYLYQQQGKLHLLQKYERVRDDDEFDVEVKREGTAAPGEHELGDLAPVDVGAIEKIGAGFEPKRDYDRVNERSVFELDMLEILSEVIAKKRAKRPRFNRVSFDLDNATLSYK